MKRTIVILMGVASLFVAAGLMLPALAKAREFGSMPGEALGFYTLGIVLAIFGVSATLCGLIGWIKRKPA